MGLFVTMSFDSSFIVLFRRVGSKTFRVVVLDKGNNTGKYGWAQQRSPLENPSLFLSTSGKVLYAFQLMVSEEQASLTTNLQPPKELAIILADHHNV